MPYSDVRLYDIYDILRLTVYSVVCVLWESALPSDDVYVAPYDVVLTLYGLLSII